MRVLIAAVVLAVGSTFWLVTPAGAADAAPTNVHVSWADSAHTDLLVTWDEVGSQPNEITFIRPGTTFQVSSTSAADPNSVTLQAWSTLNYPVLRVGVFIALPGGPRTSPAGLSEEFDASLPANTVFDQLAKGASGTFVAKWHAEPLVDLNPGDPLDLPPMPQQYRVEVRGQWANLWGPVTPQSTATEATFTSPIPPPFAVSVSAANEWGKASGYGGSRQIEYDRFGKLSIPQATAYGRPTIVSGTLERMTQWCDVMSCLSEVRREAPRSVALQARTTASTPWYLVGVTLSSSTGAFTFAPTALGTRQYRVVVRDVYDAVGLGLGVTSGAGTALTKARVLSATFADPTATYGQRVTARVKISPPVNVRTTLQRWDGKAWRDLKWVTTSGGYGAYTFSAAQRGRFAYRFLVPAFSYAGRPLSGQVSANFLLTTR
jgi:hypothetical protein